MTVTRTGRTPRTQGLTEGAILAALVAVLAVATQYVPPIGLATTFLCPLPLAVLVIRHGLRVAILATVVSVLVASAIAGPLVGLVILVSFAPMGLVLGLGGRLGWPAARIVLVASLTSVLSTAASVLGLLGGGRLEMAEMTAAMERGVAMSVDLYRRFGIPEAQIEATTKQMLEFARLMPYLLPMMLLFGGATTAWLNYEVGRRVLARFAYRLPALPPVRTWRLPSWAVWLVPLGYLALAVGTRPGAPAVWQSIGWSSMLAVQSLFALQGLVVGWVVLGNYGFGRVARATAVALVFAVPAMGIVVFALGVLDSVLKVRERWGLPQPAGRGAQP